MTTSFEVFARGRLPALLRFATALCADAALAEDIVQDVVLRVHRDWDRIDGLAAPEAYLRRAVVNEYISWRRKWARLIPHSTVPDIAETPDHADLHATRSELAGQIAALPARQRAVLVMRYYADLSDGEIADALGCRKATVRGYVARALATLRIELTDSQPSLEAHQHAKRN